ncbi:MAG: hypothetical protein JWQ38_3155 [Flavipsychrobacter sp.]|nr:hypothetical protein [Flavipsychrobacter sp.]
MKTLIMKRLLRSLMLLIIFCYAYVPAVAQLTGSNRFTFEADDTIWIKVMQIDTVNYRHNQWQAGKPQKTVFNAAYAGTYALVTDTINAYAPNDTSVFTLTFPGRVHPSSYPSWLVPWIDHFSFYYQLNMDTTSFARLEFSQDSGKTWIDLQDSTPFAVVCDTLLTTTGWHSWSIRFISPGYYMYSDSLKFRFTFVSGSDTMSRDGWMIDEMYLNYMFEGINDIHATHDVTLYPNPACDQLTIISGETANKDGRTASIYDIAGRLWCKYSLTGNSTTISTADIPCGVYQCLIDAGDAQIVNKKLVIVR